jgi:hypothetical protein
MRHSIFTLTSWGLSLSGSSLMRSMPSFNLSLNNVIGYFATMRVGVHEILSLFGFFTFLTLALQLLSGTMLAFSLVPEAMLVAIVREEEELEDLYTDDFF